jgi:cellulose biosynthesis protein BcsQ
MALKISLFNHKGGVSKTTTAFNLGWMIASKRKRVLLVDCDPQCNLTGMVLGFSGVTDLTKFYKTDTPHNIRDGLAPAFESRPTPVRAVTCEKVRGQANMVLLPGHIGLAEYEVTLGIAQELSGSLVTLQNLPGSLNFLINETAQKYKADYVLIDMSPSLGPVNQNLLMISDFFLVPMNPDYFSAMALDSLASILPKWKAWATKAESLDILRNASYPFPTSNPRFLGTIVQKYRLQKGLIPAAAFQKWIDEIEDGVKNKLLPALKTADMLLPPTTYKKHGYSPERPFLQMPDFNSLIALSQEHQVPVFALTDQQIGKVGSVLSITKKSMRKFRQLFSQAADRVIAVTSDADRA